MYFVASLITQASALLRYVVLARLLGPEQLGLVASLTITATFFDQISDTGSDRFLIQDRDGDAVSVQKLVQSVYLGRGLLVAAALLIFAFPIAQLYHAPGLVVGLAVLALSPLISGFMHLDIRRVQRDHDFRSQAICMIASESAALLVTIIAAWWTRNFTAILYALIARAIVMVILSHLLANRPYRLGWDRNHAPRLSRFAAPLMLNGLLLFLVSQGDRVIVGNQLGLKALGQYTALMLLIYYPSTLLANYIHAIYIPLIAAQRDNPAERKRVCDALGGQTLALALALAVGFAVVAPWLAPIMFGARFAQTAILVGLIGILQTTRFLLNWPTTVALALGRSTTVLASNLAHLLAFAGAILGLRLVGGLAGVLIGFIVGEMMAVAIALTLLNRNMERNPFEGYSRVAGFALASGAIIGWNQALSAGSWWAAGGMLFVSGVLVAWLAQRESAVINETMTVARRLASALFFRIKHP